MAFLSRQTDALLIAPSMTFICTDSETEVTSVLAGMSLLNEPPPQADSTEAQAIERAADTASECFRNVDVVCHGLMGSDRTGEG